MGVAGIIVSFLFTFGVLALVGFALVRSVLGKPEGTHERPTVDDGWRSISF